MNRIIAMLSLSLLLFSCNKSNNSNKDVKIENSSDNDTLESPTSERNNEMNSVEKNNISCDTAKRLVESFNVAALRINSENIMISGYDKKISFELGLITGRFMHSDAELNAAKEALLTKILPAYQRLYDESISIRTDIADGKDEAVSEFEKLSFMNMKLAFENISYGPMDCM